MKYKEYSKDFWQQIESKTEQVLKNDPRPVAAFDADGTLWDTDLGETFFQYQIDNKLVPLPANAFDHYHELKKKNNDPREAYLWLAQISQNVPLNTVREWSKQSLINHQPVPVFEEQKKLIQFFLKKNIEVYIVTASIKWAVEPGAELVGLGYDNVIGIETNVKDDLVTAEQKGIITYRQGKVDALFEKTNGKAPFFASGNTMGDFQLLKSATHLALAVSAASRDDELFKTENELREKAKENGWMAHRFV